ncbi:MAG: DUF488 family protein [Synergistaceae bacterium]|nr:DUF488 family protein [Synergistaceae bacterium]
MAHHILCKRIYEPPAASDGCRVLVDRLWPRGIRKEAAELFMWARGAAPSSELRKWFAHEPGRYQEFCERYRLELNASKDARELAAICAEELASRNVTLLYAARNVEQNNAIVLQDWLHSQGTEE